MKAVIVDLAGSDAVILRSDGRFERIKNQHYSIGQEITLPAKTFRFPKQAVVAASAAFVITACGGFGTYTWARPISYVSLDINPSIAYTLNEFDRVISISGMNEEGEAVVAEIGDSLKNKDITTALTITVEQLSADDYIDAEDTNYMIIGVYSDKEKKASDLMTSVDAFSSSTDETCSITTVNVSKETKEAADSYGITAGKMTLIEEIADATGTDDIDPSAYSDLTVAELEETKTAAVTGASIAESDADTKSDAGNQSEDAAVAAAKADPDAIISEDKPEDAKDTSTTKQEVSSDKKDTPSAPVVAEPSTGSATSVSDAATKPAEPTTNSTDANGHGSSEKKDKPQDADKSSSSSKSETVSSEKKDSSSSSKNTKEEAVSAEESSEEDTSAEETSTTNAIESMIGDTTEDTTLV